MKKIATSWPTVSLYEFCNPKQWPTIPQTAFVEAGYPVYGANGKIGYYTEFNHEKPTVLITCRGATCGTINVCEPKSYVTGNAMALDDLDESRVSLGYLVHALRRGNLAKAITGTAQPQITRQSLTAISIPLPPLPEQRRIAEVLDRAEALQAKRRNVLTQLDTLTQSIFLGMFGDPASGPRDMSLAPLDEHLLFVTSGSRGWAKYYAPTGSRFIRSLDVQMNHIRCADPTFVEAPDNAEARRTRVMAGDVLLTITGSRIGRVAPVSAALAGSYISQHVAILRIDSERIEPNFLSFFLSLETGGQRQIAKAQYGQTKPGLNFEQIRRFQIPVPPVKSQKDFAGRAAAVERLEARHRASLTELDALFASLQNRAFWGEL